MHKLEPTIIFVRIDNQFIGYGGHEWWTVLPHTVKTNLNIPKFKIVHWRDALDAFDHARGNGRKEQFCRIESSGATVHIGIENDFGILTADRTAVCIDAFCDNVIFEHCDLSGDCKCGSTVFL